jgi:hypothetical protein
MQGEQKPSMRERDHKQRNEQILQRVRCSQCRLPLVQVYQGDLTYTFHSSEEETTSYPVPVHAYRALTDPTPLLSCPSCGALLSPAAVTIANPVTLVTEEGKEARHSKDV